MEGRLAIAFACLGLAVPGLLADWPTARGDAGRTAAAASGPSGRLQPGWSLATGTPAPAWAGEARGSLWQGLTNSLLSRAADDVAPVPVIGSGKVVFATTLDEVRCVDLRTGRTEWRHFCGAPARYAPTLSGGRVFVGADDGQVQALDLASGRPVWSATVGSGGRWIAGNGRPVQVHPVRTGLLVSDGTVFVGAGLFPIEGTFLVALDVSDGRVKWRRDLGNESPQGYLVDAGADILVPQGRASPRLYRKSDGSPGRAVASASGTVAVVSEGETLAGPGPTGKFEATQAASGARIVSYAGRQMAVTRDRSYVVDGLELLALDRARLKQFRGDLARATLWKAPCGGGTALAVAGGRVYCGTSDTLEVFDAGTGRPEASLPVGNPVVAVAVDEAGVVVSSRDGMVRAFLPAGETAAMPSPAFLEAPPVDSRHEAEVRKWLEPLPPGPGWALWAGTGDPRGTVAALVRNSRLQITVLASGEGAAQELRKMFAGHGWLGTRVSVVPRAPEGPVPFVDGLFNLVIGDGLTVAEARRLASPGPAGWIVRDGTVTAAPAAPDAGSWTHQYGTAGNTCASAQSLAGRPRLRWFGGHGPEKMPDRHTRGHAPLAAGGLLVSMGENVVVATDARNGSVRWELPVPDSMRYAMPYDGGYAALEADGSSLHVAVDAELWSVETRGGTVSRRTPCPEPGLHWGWVALVAEPGRSAGSAPWILGSAMNPGAPRTVKQYELVDLDYRSERPLVCSKSVFRLSRPGAAPAWSVRTEGLFVNATFCADPDHVFVVEALGPKARGDSTGRLNCAALLEDARVVCLETATGQVRWTRPLRWPEAKDILGLAVSGGRLFLSSAESVGGHAEYRLKCWSVADGSETWQARARNPVNDLYHGQQVKRPVILADRVAFESGLFEIATGKPWAPAGRSADWILSRPGHACGGMTGAGDGLLFRADNPTFFRLSDGSFTRLAPTRPGCWLNILPAAGGVLIPEASASCICGYPLQTSMGFVFGD